MAAMATPLGRYAKPEEIAGQIAFLLSDEAALHHRRLPGQRWRLFALACCCSRSRSPPAGRAASAQPPRRGRRRRPASSAASKARPSPSAATTAAATRSRWSSTAARAAAQLRRAARPSSARAPGALRFAMNAGMYDEAGRPDRPLCRRGPRAPRDQPQRRARQFPHAPQRRLPVDADGRVAIVAEHRYDPGRRARAGRPNPGPMLVIDGALHPAIQRQRPLAPHPQRRRRRRSRTRPGSRSATSRSRSAASPACSATCSAAATRSILDGAVSSLWDRPGGRMDTYSRLGPLVAVFDARKEED